MVVIGFGLLMYKLVVTVTSATKLKSRPLAEHGEGRNNASEPLALILVCEQDFTRRSTSELVSRRSSPLTLEPPARRKRSNDRARCDRDLPCCSRSRSHGSGHRAHEPAKRVEQSRRMKGEREIELPATHSLQQLAADRRARLAHRNDSRVTVPTLHLLLLLPMGVVVAG